MGFQISPGVNVSEIDLTGSVPAVATTDAGFCGVFQWGPLDEPTLIESEKILLQRFGKPDSETATSYFTAANFLAYGNKLRLIRVADTTKTLERTIEDVSSNALNETVLEGADFLESPRIRPGDSIEAGGETRTVITVTSDTELVIDEAFTTALDDDEISVTVYDGCLNATTEEGTGTDAPGIGLLIKNRAHYETQYANGQANVGVCAARHPGDLGNSMKVSICPSAAAFQQTLAGTASNASGSTTVTGISTAFLASVIPGSILKDSVTGQERRVGSVASDTSLEVDSAFEPNLAGATLIARWEFALSVGTPPSTSPHVSARGGSTDEMHIVVVDVDGKITGLPNQILEIHSFVSKAADAKTDDGASSYYVNVLNNRSRHIYHMDHLPVGTNWGHESLNTTFVAPAKPHTVRLLGGRDRNATVGVDMARMAGYSQFSNAEEIDISLVLLGAAGTALVGHVIHNICEHRKDCMAFISPPMDAVVDNQGHETVDSITFRNTLPSTSYAVMDSGWKYQYDRHNDMYRWVPLNGDIAGLCARTDTERDPWWSPAGFTRGNIQNIIKLSYSPRKGERDDLYLSGINPVISSPGEGILLYGDKTLLSRPSAFDRINVRRLFIVLEKAIAKAAKILLFEFNDEFTRQQFRNMVEPFLRDVQARRGIYDFRVVCDSTNNSPEVIDRNEFVGDIYIKPARSINFIQLNFVAVRTGVEFSEIIGRF